MWDAYYKITIMMTDIWTILLLWLLLIDFMNEADFSKTSFHSGKCHIFHTREMLNVKCCFTLFGHTPYSHSWLWVPHIKIADLWCKCRDEAYPKCLLGELSARNCSKVAQREQRKVKICQNWGRGRFLPMHMTNYIVCLMLVCLVFKILYKFCLPVLNTKNKQNIHKILHKSNISLHAS